MTLRIRSAVHPYTAAIAPGAVTDQVLAMADLASLPADKLLVVADQQVRDLYPTLPLLKAAEDRVVSLTATELVKTPRGVQALYDSFMRLGLTRKHTVVAIGGGIIQDVTSFACHTYMRGIDWWFLPSTLLAQADSCIGSKTSINYKGTKNLLGSFYPPVRIVIDPTLLATLAPREVLSGLGEVAKVHCMDRPASVDQLMKDLPRLKAIHPPTMARYIRRSLAIKLRYVRVDEFDRGVRQQLNYGHCFGHALEAATAYRVPHGVAVMFGILFANRLSFRRGCLPLEDNERMESLLRSLIGGLKLPRVDAEAVLAQMGRDKKREGPDLAVILTAGIGRTFKATDVTAEEYWGAFQSLAAEGWW